jgi:hypothetical protein
MVRPNAVALALCALAACRTPPARPRSRPVVTIPRPPIAAPTAPWLESPYYGSATTLRFFTLVDAAYGAAVVEARHGTFVVHEHDGVSGPYDLGDIDDATFTADQTLYAVNSDGSIRRAERKPGVGLAEPVRLVGVAGAIAIVGGRKVVATWTADAVHVSTNRAESFVAVGFAKSETIDRVLTRADDTIVVQTLGPRGRVTRVSRDLGKTFHESVRVPPLERLGDLLYGYDDTCGFSPAWPALSSAGSFVIAADAPSPTYEARRRSLADWFETSNEPSEAPAAPMPWATDLVAPPASSPKYTGYPLCDPPTGHTHPHRRTKVVKMIESAGTSEEPVPCSGVACIRGLRVSRRPPTRTRAAFLRDGPRHVLFTDDAMESVRVVALPESCSPRFVTHAGGLVVLACNDALYASTSEGRWRESWAHNFAGVFKASDFEMTADGTAMLAHYEGPPRAVVRAPVGIGPGAWRDVTRPGAEDYAVRNGGVVDVLVGDGTRLTVIEDAPTGAREIVSHVDVGGDLWCFGRKDGALVGIRRNAAGSFERIAFSRDAVASDGKLLNGSDATDETGACGF